jgi:hypothetical protein
MKSRKKDIRAFQQQKLKLQSALQSARKEKIRFNRKERSEKCWWSARAANAAL